MGEMLKPADEKIVFSYVSTKDWRALSEFLELCVCFMDLTQAFDSSGYSLLHIAAFKNSTRCCEVLVNYVGRRSSSLLTSWINLRTKNQEGFTAIQYAAFNGNAKVCRLLLGKGADLSVENNHRINPVHLAAQGDQPATLHLFLGAGVDVNAVDNKESSALHWAAYSGSELVLHYLLALGANLEARDREGLTPLHIAVKMSEEAGHTRIVRFLLVKGASRQAKVRFLTPGQAGPPAPRPASAHRGGSPAPRGQSRPQGARLAR